MAIVYLTSDLMFSSRVSSVAKQQGVELLMAPTANRCVELIEQNEVTRLLIDLNTAGLNIAELMQQVDATGKDLDSIAYGPHVQVGKLQAAQTAGCDQILSNGQFNQQMGELLQG